MSEATRGCADCGADISARHWRSKRCEACQFERERRAMNTKHRSPRTGPPARYQRVCQHCGVTFWSSIKKGRYCGPRCSGEATHPGTVQHTCTVCRLDFMISLQFDKTECSRRCLVWRQAHPGEDLVTECRWCGSDLLADKQRRTRAIGAEWCDDRCWHAWKAGILWETIRDRRCVVCNDPIPVTVHLYRKVCSDLCKTRNRSIEVLFRQTHARRKRLDEASLTHRVPKRVIYALRRLPCAYCGGPGGTVDHVIPLARGGHHAEGNLVPACRSCWWRPPQAVLAGRGPCQVGRQARAVDCAT
jgi:hypothetical protein